MTYIDIVNHFWNENRVNRCDTYEVAVFFYILNEANKQRWVDKIKISTNILTAELGISRKTLINTRKKLKDKNLINFEPGIKNKLTSIYMIYVSNGNIQGNIQRNIEGNIEGNIQRNMQGNHLNKNKNKSKSKNIINDKKNIDLESKDKLFLDQVLSYSDKYGTDMCMSFYRHWGQCDNSKGLLHYEKEKTWDLPKRLATWSNNQKKWYPESTKPKQKDAFRDNLNSNNGAKQMIDMSDMFDENGMLRRQKVPIEYQ